MGIYNLCLTKESTLKHLNNPASVMVVAAVSVFLVGCTINGQSVEDSLGDHQVNVFTASQDSKPLSQQVRQKLRKNPQTAVTNIRVSQDSEDTVKLSGFVNNDAIRQDAERIAYQIEGVRFVVNNLSVQR